MTDRITTGMSVAELTDMGRAMERCGCTDVNDYVRRCAITQTSAILAEQEKLQKVSEKPAS